MYSITNLQHCDDDLSKPTTKCKLRSSWNWALDCERKKTTELKLQKIWRSLKFCKNSGKRAHLWDEVIVTVVPAWGFKKWNGQEAGHAIRPRLFSSDNAWIHCRNFAPRHSIRSQLMRRHKRELAFIQLGPCLSLIHSQKCCNAWDNTCNWSSVWDPLRVSSRWALMKSKEKLFFDTWHRSTEIPKTPFATNFDFEIANVWSERCLRLHPLWHYARMRDTH